VISLLASAVLFVASVAILIIALVLFMAAVRVTLDERPGRRTGIQPHHDDGEEWPTGMDTWS
jgi:hypothetical protein